MEGAPVCHRAADCQSDWRWRTRRSQGFAARVPRCLSVTAAAARRDIARAPIHERSGWRTARQEGGSEKACWTTDGRTVDAGELNVNLVSPQRHAAASLSRVNPRRVRIAAKDAPKKGERIRARACTHRTAYHRWRLKLRRAARARSIFSFLASASHTCVLSNRLTFLARMIVTLTTAGQRYRRPARYSLSSAFDRLILRLTAPPRPSPGPPPRARRRRRPLPRPPAPSSAPCPYPCPPLRSKIINNVPLDRAVAFTQFRHADVRKTDQPAGK
jgi:hypothetical protein